MTIEVFEGCKATSLAFCLCITDVSIYSTWKQLFLACLLDSSVFKRLSLIHQFSECYQQTWWLHYLHTGGFWSHILIQHTHGSFLMIEMFTSDIPLPNNRVEKNLVWVLLGQMLVCPTLDPNLFVISGDEPTECLMESWSLIRQSQIQNWVFHHHCPWQNKVLHVKLALR